MRSIGKEQTWKEWERPSGGVTRSDNVLLIHRTTAKVCTVDDITSPESIQIESGTLKMCTELSYSVSQQQELLDMLRSGEGMRNS